MRTLIDLTDAQLIALEKIQQREKTSRTELIRRAVDRYLIEEQKSLAQDIDKYHGFLAGTGAFDGLDGLAWQEKMRGEWDDRNGTHSRWGLHDQPQSAFKHDTNEKGGQ
jgi:hypothetical protein